MTTTTLRPNATVSAGTVEGAANAHTALSDDSDSSYVDDTAFTVVDMGTFTLPAGGVTKQARARARTSSIASGGSAFVVAPPSGSEGPTVTGTASTIATFTGAYEPVTWNQATIDALRLAAGDESSPDADLSFYELYLDVVYVTIPVTTVAAVSPDPYTASNIVPIAWANTLDSDGGGQTRYEVKVFTDAQYGAGGFDPETSEPYWTSGVVLSSSLTVNTGALATGDTYRSYVRVAQTVNGVSHWSAWAFDTFAVDVDTADVDTITATPHDALARIQIDVARDALGEAWDFIEVQRSTDSGTTWTPVRLANYVDATGDADDFQVFDYEVANGQNVTYRARATRIVSDLPITGEWVTSGATVTWSSDSAWLKSPGDPTKNQAVIIETPFATQEREVRSGVFQVIGRADPIVISDVLTTPFTSIRVRTETVAELTAMLDLLRDVILLFHPLTESLAGPDQAAAQYISVLNVTEDQRVPYYSEYRLWVITFVEVTAPADPTAGQ